MSTVVDLDYDWAEEEGWRCLFCGGDIDHHVTVEFLDYSEDSYQCVEKQHAFCEYAYFMVRWSNTQRGKNGDAKTLWRWVQLEGLTVAEHQD